MHLKRMPKASTSKECGEECLVSFATSNLAKQVDITKVGRKSKIQSVTNCFSIPCKWQARRRVAKVGAMRR